MNPIQAYTLLHKGAIALARAEQAGIRVDLAYLENKYAHLTRQMAYHEKKFKESKFYKEWDNSQEKEPNPNSSVQLSTFLYETKGLTPPSLTASGKGSTNKESLLALNIPELNIHLEAKKLKKIRDYLEGFRREQVNGWMHPNFNLHLVTTFRSSSDKPNFQNIPKRDKLAMQTTRKVLYPRPGHQLLEVDYSGLEVRIAACYHKDPVMLKYIRTGYDMHADMASQIFKIPNFDKHKPEHGYLRGATKNGFVFPEFYGDYYKNCAESMACQWGELPKGRWKEGQGVAFEGGHLSDHMIASGFKSLDSFTKHLKIIEDDFWGKRFKVYARWKEQHWRQYQKTGYVDLLTGFRCKGVMGKNDAINYPIQGSAFHCLLWSFIQADDFLLREGWDSRIIGQVHDSIVLDIHPDEREKLVQRIIQITTVDLPAAWKWINVPLDVDFEICPVDASWASKEEMVLD